MSVSLSVRLAHVISLAHHCGANGAVGNPNPNLGAGWRVLDRTQYLGIAVGDNPLHDGVPAGQRRGGPQRDEPGAQMLDRSGLWVDQPAHIASPGGLEPFDLFGATVRAREQRSCHDRSSAAAARSGAPHACTQLRSAAALRSRSSATRHASATASGTTRLAASVGVAARRSAT